MTSVELTPAQFNRLESIADEDPDARVVGHSVGRPVLRRGDGRVQAVQPTGRLTSSEKIRARFCKWATS